MSVAARPPRVRFCPAPSGWLHVGSARTALYNWLYARQHDGAFVFRIEDTDADRVTDESMHSMMNALRFLGLAWDEGPDVGGPYGPYRQSERHDLYAAVAQLLLESGAAYEAFETPEELAAQRAGLPMPEDEELVAAGTKKLDGGPLEAFVENKPAEEHEYKGEFYPVDRHINKKK